MRNRKIVEEVEKEVILIALEGTEISFNKYDSCFYNPKTKKYKIIHDSLNYYCEEKRDYYISGFSGKCLLLNKDKTKEATEELLKQEINASIANIERTKKIISKQQEKVYILNQHLLNQLK